jgi:hypothetical protein
LERIMTAEQMREAAAKIIESMCYAFEDDEVCREVNANLRKAAREVRAIPLEETCPDCGLPHPATNPYCFCKPV